MHIPAETVVLIDGSSYLFRAYHALPPLTNSAGHPTGAIFGMLNMLKKTLADFKPKYIAVVFDSKVKNFRHDLFAEYKANRRETPNDLLLQFEPIKEIIQALGIKVITVEGVEADDVIGSMAQHYAKNNIYTLISTSDKDFAQLVTDNIGLVNTMSGSYLDAAGVMAKFKVSPEQIIDYLALVGDSVDNIPGVPKVGPKTAAKWLQEYVSLENLTQNAEQITGKIGENLRESLVKLDLYKQLVTIKTDIPVEYAINDLQQQVWDFEQLEKLLKRYEIKNWLEDLKKQKAQQPSLESEQAHSLSDKKIIASEFKVIASLEEVQNIVDIVYEDKSFVLTVQVDAPHIIDANLLGLVIASEHLVPCFINFDEKIIDIDVIKLLQPILQANSGCQIIGYNLKFTLAVLNRFLKLHGLAEINIEHHLFDVSLAAYNLNSVLANDLASLSLIYLAVDKFTSKDAALQEILIQEINIIFQLQKILQAKLASLPEIAKIFYDMEMPTLVVLMYMELQGVYVDAKFLQDLSAEFADAIKLLEEEIFCIAGTEFNLSSPKQLQQILFEKLNLPVIKKTPKGQPSTNEAVLQELAKEFELPQKILNYRTLFKLKNTYTDKLPLDIKPATNRVHTTFHQNITSTGRLSSSDPNMQNIPVKSQMGSRIREAFVASPGNKLLVADYSQIELRIMAHLSQDETLIKAFKEGLDVHALTASEVFAVPLANVTSGMRRSAKAINFGLIYGMSAYGLSVQLQISPKEADIYIQTYFERFAGVREYMETTRKQAAQLGFIETMFGRRLYLPDINASNINLRKAAERAAINAPMQGAQADIIKMAMLKIHQWLISYDDIKMILQVHDELVFEVADKQISTATSHISNIMQNAANLVVPLTVGIGVGSNWQNAKG